MIKKHKNEWDDFLTSLTESYGFKRKCCPIVFTVEGELIGDTREFYDYCQNKYGKIVRVGNEVSEPRAKANAQEAKEFVRKRDKGANLIEKIQKTLRKAKVKKLVSNLPRNRFEKPDKKEKISIVQGEILNLEKFTRSLEIEDLDNKEILDHLESNINSFLPSHENTSILTEGKSSIHFPQPQQYNHKNFVSRNRNLQPDAIKKRLNSDIQKCQFYESLYCHMKQNSTVNRPSSELNDIELTGVETARFGKSQDYGGKRINRDLNKAIRNMRQRPSNYKPHSK